MPFNFDYILGSISRKLAGASTVLTTAFTIYLLLVLASYIYNSSHMARLGLHTTSNVRDGIEGSKNDGPNSTQESRSLLSDEFASANVAANGEGYHLTVMDIKKVERLLLHKVKPTLPIEIIDMIIQKAEYWAHGSITTTRPSIVSGNRDPENKFIVSNTNYLIWLGTYT
jgi:hypothetical protein